MTARNAPCPCGSGKKFKVCHGLLAETSEPGNQALKLAQEAQSRGQLAEAVHIADQAQDSPAKFSLLASLLMKRRAPGDMAKARTRLRQWAAREPANLQPWQRIVEIYLSENNLEKANQALRHMQKLLPGQANTQYFKGVLLQLSGELEEALESYAEAILLQNDSSTTALARDSSALFVAAAMQLYETAAGNFPGSSRFRHSGLFDAKRELGILESRLLAWEKDFQGLGPGPATEHAREFAIGWYNLGCAALAAFTEDDRRVQLFQKAIDLNPGHVLARLNCAFSMNYSTTASAEDIFTLHRKTGAWLEQQFGQPADFSAHSRKADHPIRMAYLSSDFRSHSVAHFILPVLECHDREKFEIYLYYNHEHEDEYTHRARQLAARFRQVRSLSDQALCAAIRSDAIDILVDLNGMTEHNRMPVLAMRAAPVQISWIGYPNTSGLGTVDYRVVDEMTDPPAHAAELNTEKLLYLSPAFLVYQPPAELPGICPPPSRDSGYITFGSFNSMPKLNETLVRVWSGILRRVTDSKILLQNIALGSAEPRRQLLDAFARHGIDAMRVQFLGPTPDKKAHFETFGMVDIALDSYPYNGTTTTCDSLVMGVPVITWCGDDHRSRVGASLLNALHLESWVGNDENAYSDIASQLANDPQRLALMRSGLRARIQSSPLMDASRFTRALERKFTQAWASWCREEVNT